MRKAFRSSLEIQTILIILPVLVIILLAGGFLVRFLLNDLIEEIYENGLMSDAETIELSIRHALMVQNYELVQRIIFNNSLHSQTEAIRLISLEGIVVASLNIDEIGVKLNLESKQCQGCHVNDNSLKQMTRRLPSLTKEQQVLMTVKPVENQVACQNCHDASTSNLGLILMEHSSAQIDGWLHLLDQIMAGGGILILVTILGAVFIVLRWKITHPLKQVISKDFLGNMNDRFDEIGQVSRLRNELETKLGKRETELGFQQRSFNALLTISESLGVSSSIEMVFQQALTAMRNVTDFGIGIRLYNANNKCFKLIAHHGLSSEMVKTLDCIPDNKSFQGEALATKSPVLTYDLSTDPRTISQAAINFGYRSLICV